MGSTYEYVYEYEVPSNTRTQRTTGATGTSYQQRSAVQQPVYHQTASTFGRSNNMDPLVNLQHDRIWHKLYDPIGSDKASNETEAQKMARRQDRKVIKLEAAYGSDRQTFIVKRNHDLRVCDVQEDAAKVFKIPVDSLVLYWKGRNIVETPNELLEALGIENNHQMRVCRDDDPMQQNRRRELRAQPGSDQMYSSSAQQQQQGAPYSSQYDQQGYGGATQRTNYYQQLTSPNASIAPPPPGPVASSFLLNLQIGFGDRLEGMIVGRPHPITVYDLQVELQQRFNIPVLDQNVSYNGMSLTQFPPDAALESLGIVNNSFVSLWYKTQQQQPPPPPPPQQQQQQQHNDYYSSRQAQPPASMYGDMSQTSRGNEPAYDSMQNNANQEVMKIEVFHGSDRHVLILRSTNNLRIIDLMEELQRITTVPINNQKLYFRGQELQQMKDRTLREAGIDNNAQVRLIGDPTKVRYEAMISGNRP